MKDEMGHRDKETIVSTEMVEAGRICALEHTDEPIDVSEIYRAMNAARPSQPPADIGEIVERITDVLARFPCRADEPELDLLRRREVARALLAALGDVG